MTTQKKGPGGSRPGAGRKAKAKLPYVPSKEVANDVLASIDEVAYWREFLHAGKVLATLSDRQREEVRWALKVCVERARGLPAQQIMAGGKIIFELVKLGANRSPAKTI
jgi:hypothetical protein